MRTPLVSAVCATLLTMLFMYNANGADFVIPADVESCLAKSWVTDPYSLQGPAGCRELLTKYMQGHWREVFQHWDEVATTDKRKWVLLNLGESLDSSNYIEFLEMIREMRIKGKIKPEMFERAVVLSGGRKESFLALNYKHSRVQAYIKSIRGLLSPTHGKYLDEVNSGTRAKDFKEEYSNNKIAIGSDLLLSPEK